MNEQEITKELDIDMEKTDQTRYVVFLDIDGVLQPTSSQDRFNHDMEALQKELAEKYNDPEYQNIDKYDVAAVYYDWNKNAVQNLKYLLGDHGEIVLLSDWRQFNTLENLRRLFRIHDLELAEIVPYESQFSNKRDDLPKYLAKHPDLKHYVIIDDLNMEKEFPGHFVHIKFPRRYLDQSSAMRAKTIMEYGPWWEMAHLETKWAYDLLYKRIDTLPVIHDGYKKVIFLDFDGVVNDDLGSSGDGIVVRPEAVGLLHRIVDETKAEIVFSSSRKRAYAGFVENGYRAGNYAQEDMQLFQEILDEHYVHISGMTPEIKSGPIARPLEIRAWLSCRPDVEAFVILDDDTFWMWGDELESHVVTTAYKSPDPHAYDTIRGLTGHDAEDAIRILKEGTMPHITFTREDVKRF